MSLSSTPNCNRSNTRIANDAGYKWARSSTGGQVSILGNANNVHVKNSSFSITASISTLDVLYQRVAPNAILNEGGRADDAKCHTGTREEVIGLIEKWMSAAESNRMLWLTGPAGGGKTAIMKTIAERSTTRRVHTVNFFFFRGDSTRNSAHPVVSTLLYQLFELHPPCCEAVAEIISTRPRILDGSITQQCKLISRLSSVIQELSPTSAPIVLLIDGLDECDVDAESSQGEILRAFERLVMDTDSPFRLLIASRPEARIQMAFNQLALPAQTIFLDEQYRPENDIQLFVDAEFDRIKASHPSASSLQRNWPSSSDVKGIVAKSSGQFIYAATVMRYIAHASTVPSLSLERVKGIVPVGNNSPFTHLDSIYAFILSRADDPRAMRDILSMNFLERTVLLPKFDPLSLQERLQHYDSRYSQSAIQSCVSELSAIVVLNNGRLKFYHASLPDFLLHKARAGTLWIDIDAFRSKVLLAIWEKPPIPSISFFANMQAELFLALQNPTPDLTHMLLDEPLPEWTMDPKLRIEGCQEQRLIHIHKLYYADDVKTYKHILRRWIFMLVSRYRRPYLVDIPYAAEYFYFYARWNWLFRLLNSIHRKN